MSQSTLAVQVSGPDVVQAGWRALLIRKRCRHCRSVQFNHWRTNAQRATTTTAVQQVETQPNRHRTAEQLHRTDRAVDGRPETTTAESSEDADDVSSTGAYASITAIGGIALLIGLGYYFQDDIKGFIDFFTSAVEQWGPLGYAAYMLVYTGLEVLAVPAIPLTMTAGAIFGPVVGTGIVSVAATAAATVSFLVARYALRDKVMQVAKSNPKFGAIDKVIGKNGFKVVTMLRLSPLLPLALSNYLYGLTSVDLNSYVSGSFLGMLPGTFAYVMAGYLSKSMLTGDSQSDFGVPAWQLAIAVVISAISVAYVGKLAKSAIDELEHEKPDGAKPEQ